MQRADLWVLQSNAFHLWMNQQSADWKLKMGPETTKKQVSYVVYKCPTTMLPIGGEQVS